METFLKGESLFCGVDEIHCQRGRHFQHICTPHFYTILFCVLGMCFVHIFLDLLLILLLFTFSFQNLENLKVK